MKKLFAGWIVLVLFCLQAATAVEIDSCTDITSPGYYSLKRSISGLLDGENYCIGIFASDVVLEGNGYSIAGGRSGSGIYIGANNVTVKNLSVKNYETGIFLDSSSNSTLTNSNISNNEYEGIILFYSSNNNISKIMSVAVPSVSWMNSTPTNVTTPKG